MPTTITRLALAAATFTAATLLAAQPAGADHAHFIYQPEKGNHAATCRHIAAGQTEKAADDPGGHAFHEHVHTGQPGSDGNGTDFDKDSNAGNYECTFVTTS